MSRAICFCRPITADSTSSPASCSEKHRYLLVTGPKHTELSNTAPCLSGPNMPYIVNWCYHMMFEGSNIHQPPSSTGNCFTHELKEIRKYIILGSGYNPSISQNSSTLCKKPSSLWRGWGVISNGCHMHRLQ